MPNKAEFVERKHSCIDVVLVVAFIFGVIFFLFYKECVRDSCNAAGRKMILVEEKP